MPPVLTNIWNYESIPLSPSLSLPSKQFWQRGGAAPPAAARARALLLPSVSVPSNHQKSTSEPI
eukprot:378139-Pleurochrysis_carterae.AAC.1